MSEQKEVEVKILEVDREAIVNKLISLGAEKIFDGVLKMHSFKLEKGKLLRVRKEGPDTFLVFKQRNGKGFATDTQEYSVKVDDYDAAVALIRLLGFPDKWAYEKHRTSYRLKGVRFEFDKLLGEYDFVPEYLEIEASSEQQAKEAVAWLGIPEEKALPWTGGDVIRHYAKD